MAEKCIKRIQQTMNRHLLTLTTLLLIALAGCATPGGTAVYQPQVNCYHPARLCPEAVATLTTRCQQDAQGTIEAQAAWPRARCRRPRAVAIRQPRSRPWRIAESTAVAAAATSDNLIVRQTEQAMAFQQADATATAQANQMWLSATGTAVAVQASALGHGRGAAGGKRGRWCSGTRSGCWRISGRVRRFGTRAGPWIVGVVLLVLRGRHWLLALPACGATSQPVMQVIFDNGGNGRQTIPLIIRDAHGGFRHLPGTLPHEGGRLALPAGDEVVETAVEPIPLPKLDIGHVLIVGETGAGKSTTMRALLAHRQQAVVLDPHAGPDDWPGMQVLGGGRNFTQISEFMDWMVDELSNRAEMRRNGQTAFPPLTVATDEMPAIANELGRDVYANWQRWMREGRKFGLYIVVSTQSTRVKTMGIEGEGDVLDNFTGIVYLGKSGR
jgi:hypothetical protein